MKQRVLLFDLDGTLTDPKVGICSAVRHALTRFDIRVDSLDELTDFIGPPLHDRFPARFGFDAAQTQQAVDAFREYYAAGGWLENIPYPGIDALLSALRADGRQLLVATSKPEDLAVQILEHFDLSRHFAHICGAPKDDIVACAKAAVIRDALQRAEVCDLSSVLMIGDRSYDVFGAHEVGIPAVGVLYGYGSREELLAAGADALAEDLPALHNLLLG